MNYEQKKIPYYAVIFTLTQTEKIKGYQEMAELMENLVKLQDGFLDLDSARTEIGITVSYWTTLESIKNWKQQSEHLLAQKKGI